MTGLAKLVPDQWVTYLLAQNFETVGRENNEYHLSEYQYIKVECGYVIHCFSYQLMLDTQSIKRNDMYCITK